MRLVDAFLTFPPLLLAVALVGLLDRHPERHAGLGAGAGAGTGPHRSRQHACRARGRLCDSRPGAGRHADADLLSHILRNVMSPIVVQLTIVFSAAVVAERRSASWASVPSRRSRAGAAT